MIDFERLRLVFPIFISVILLPLAIFFFLTYYLFNYYEPTLFAYFIACVIFYSVVALTFFLVPKIFSGQFKKTESILAVLCLIFIVRSSIYLNQQISMAKSKYMDQESSFDNFEMKVIDSCRSAISLFNPNTKMALFIDPQEKIWLLINGKLSDKEKLFQYSPAGRNENVKIVAFIEETYKETGMQYAEDLFLYKSGTGIKAVIYLWKVHLIDIKKNKVIGYTEIIGPKPPDKISSRQISGNFYGIIPTEEFQAWLKTYKTSGGKEL